MHSAYHARYEGRTVLFRALTRIPDAVDSLCVQQEDTIATRHYVHSDKDNGVKELTLLAPYDTRPCFYM